MWKYPALALAGALVTSGATWGALMLSFQHGHREGASLHHDRGRRRGNCRTHRPGATAPPALTAVKMRR